MWPLISHPFVPVFLANSHWPPTPSHSEPRLIFITRRQKKLSKQIVAERDDWLEVLRETKRADETLQSVLTQPAGHQSSFSALKRMTACRPSYLLSHVKERLTSALTSLAGVFCVLWLVLLSGFRFSLVPFGLWILSTVPDKSPPPFTY